MFTWVRESHPHLHDPTLLLAPSDAEKGEEANGILSVVILTHLLTFFQPVITLPQPLHHHAYPRRTPCRRPEARSWVRPSVSPLAMSASRCHCSMHVSRSAGLSACHQLSHAFSRQHLKVMRKRSAVTKIQETQWQARCLAIL